MSKTSIELSEQVWNPVTGCTIPLKRKKPTTWFVNSMSDLFHPDVPFEFVDKVFAVMSLCPQHTFQILTKRPERMAEYTRSIYMPSRVDTAKCSFMGEEDSGYFEDGYLANVWLSTSVENQPAADARIPHLIRCPAAVRFLSCEPLLGPIRLRGEGCPWCFHKGCLFPGEHVPCRACFEVDLVIVGCESGPGMRPMNPEWAKSLVDQCRTAGVACFMKQMVVNGKVSHDPAEWPEWARVRQMPGEAGGGAGTPPTRTILPK